MSDDERDDRTYTAADIELAELRGYIKALAVVAELNMQRLNEILGRLA